MPETITIELKNLRFFANHGWHDEEAILGNEFEVTFFATFPATKNITSIEETVDYTTIFALIKKTFAQREQLLETVAQQIINVVQAAYPQLQQVQLTITKLNPLIASFTGTVGITYCTDLR